MGFTKSDYLTLHGENGITFSLFTELDDAFKIRNFLTNVKWNKKPSLPDASGLQKDKLQVHLFPSFGRKYGAGEPDTIIIYDNLLFFIEVETKSIDKLSPHFFKQLNNFNAIGEYVTSSKQKKVVGKAVSITEDKRVYGQHRTRKVFQELLKHSDPQVYYIVITNDPAEQKQTSLSSLNKLNDRIKIEIPKSIIEDKLGWIGFPSINRLEANNKTKEVIQFNLK